MKIARRSRPRRVVAAALATAALSALSAAARAGTLRVAEYNINADTPDTNGFNAAPAGAFTEVMAAIGAHHLAGNAQPIDVLALTELSGNTSSGKSTNSGISNTLATVAADLNAAYHTTTYTYDTTLDQTDSTTSVGNGPSGLVYNSATVGKVTGSVIATASSANDPRAPIRYQIQPNGGTAGSQFYLYVEHTKALSGASPAAVRANETALVRTNADALGAGANIIYTGDFNLAGFNSSSGSSGSAEQAYKNLTATGNGQAVDPLDPTGTLVNDTTKNVRLYTESAKNLTARFDLQLVSNSVAPTTGTGAGTATSGFQLVANTETAFGNSYYTTSSTGVTTLTTSNTYNKSVDPTVSGTANNALSDLSNAAAVYTDLTEVSDHLPIVADYSYADAAVAAPEPSSLLLATATVAVGVLSSRRRRLC